MGVEVVTVASRLPNPLKLRIFRQEDTFEPSPSGPVPAKRSVELPETYTVKGYNSRLDGLIVSPSWAFTPDIPKKFWDTYAEQNKDSYLFERELLMAGKEGEVQRMAKDGSDWTGLEPMRVPTPGTANPIDDPRTPFTNSKRQGIAGVGTADEQRPF
jgi:hypothetical protein